MSAFCDKFILKARPTSQLQPSPWLDDEAKMAKSDSSPFNFLLLPAEVRNEIYRLQIEEYACPPRLVFATCALESFDLPIMTAVCRKTRAEILPYFITQIHWRVQLRPGCLGGVERPHNAQLCKVLESGIFRDLTFDIFPLPAEYTYCGGEIFKTILDVVRVIISITIHPRIEPRISFISGVCHHFDPWTDVVIPGTNERLNSTAIDQMLARVKAKATSMVQQPDFEGLSLSQLDEIANTFVIKATTESPKPPEVVMDW